MKQAGILLGALLIVGCAPMKSLEELETEALRTGDWSLVEEREALIAKRNSRRPMQCGTQAVSYCEKIIGSYRCRCVPKGVIQDTFAAR